MSDTTGQPSPIKLIELLVGLVSSCLTTAIGQIGAILVALVGLAGVIYTINPPTTETATPTAIPATATLAVVVAVNPTATFDPPTATATATPSPTLLPTETQVILPTATSTATIEPTPTLTPVILGQDWQSDCISREWRVYSANRLLEQPAAACWPQPVDSAFSTFGGVFQIFKTGSTGSAYYGGVLTDLPQKSDIRFTFRLNLATLSATELWFMILPDNDPLANGIKFGVVPGNTQPGKMKFDFNGPGFDFRTDFLPAVNGDYVVHLQLGNGDVRIKINSVSFGPFPVSFANRKFFIGYRSLPGPSYWIDTVITNFSIQ